MYPYSENKGADQLRGYREADLRLCFRLCRLLVFRAQMLLNTTIDCSFHLCLELSALIDRNRCVYFAV